MSAAKPMSNAALDIKAVNAGIPIGPVNVLAGATVLYTARRERCSAAEMRKNDMTLPPKDAAPLTESEIAAWGNLLNVIRDRDDFKSAMKVHAQLSAQRQMEVERLEAELAALLGEVAELRKEADFEKSAREAHQIEAVAPRAEVDRHNGKMPNLTGATTMTITSRNANPT